jgi:hypothetical protein
MVAMILYQHFLAKYSRYFRQTRKMNNICYVEVYTGALHYIIKIYTSDTLVCTGNTAR